MYDSDTGKSDSETSRPPTMQRGGPPADLGRVVMVLQHARADRLPVTQLYRPHFLALIHVLQTRHAKPQTHAHSNASSLHPHNFLHADEHAQCIKVSAICMAHVRHPSYPDFQRPPASLLLELLHKFVPSAPRNRWLKSLERTGREPVTFSRYVQPQLFSQEVKRLHEQLLADPGAEKLAMCSGVLVGHMDFWLDPRRLALGLGADRVWRLGPGIPKQHVEHQHQQPSDPTPAGAGGRVGGDVGGGGAAGPGAALHIRVLSQRLEVRDVPELGKGTVLRTLRRGDVEEVQGGRSGLRGLSQEGAAVRVANTTMVALAGGGWVAQPLLQVGADFEVLGFYYEGHCVSSGALRNDTSGPWGWQSKLNGLRASVHLPVLGRHDWARFQGVLCGGWADLYHVPMRHAADFLELSQLFLGHHVFHEVAVPTVLHILTNGSDAQHVDVLNECFGCCCCDVDNWAGVAPALLARFPCGHRLHMERPEHRDALAQLLYKL